MIPLRAIFVAVPRHLWNLWPLDRSLANLASDALGIERRIRKRVDVTSERVKYKQLCDWIEATALEAADTQGARSLGFRANLGAEVSSAYVALSEALQFSWRVQQEYVSTRQFGSAAGQSPRGHVKDSIGKTFYPPGLLVAEQGAFFEYVTRELGKDLFSDVSLRIRREWIAVSETKVAFYREALADDCAVIEVLSAGSPAQQWP